MVKIVYFPSVRSQQKKPGEKTILGCVRCCCKYTKRTTIIAAVLDAKSFEYTSVRHSRSVSFHSWARGRCKRYRGTKRLEEGARTNIRIIRSDDAGTCLYETIVNAVKKRVVTFSRRSLKIHHNNAVLLSAHQIRSIVVCARGVVAGISRAPATRPRHDLEHARPRRSLARRTRFFRINNTPPATDGGARYYCNIAAITHPAWFRGGVG